MWIVPWIVLTLVGGVALGLGMFFFDEWKEKKRLSKITINE